MPAAHSRGREQQRFSGTIGAKAGPKCQSRGHFVKISETFRVPWSNNDRAKVKEPPYLISVSLIAA